MSKFTAGDRILTPARITSCDEDGNANVVVTTETGSMRGVTASAATLRTREFAPVGFVWDSPADVTIEGEVVSANHVAAEVRFEDGSTVTMLTSAMTRLSFAAVAA